jgi:ABC-type polysaccharide/polyol phosphate export permease
VAAVSELVASRELMVNLTLRELRGKYKRSALGWAWSLLNPLATMLIFSIVFRLFLKVPVPEGANSGLKNFALFLLCALLPWNFLSNAISGGMGSLVGNANLIKKVYFPREILVAANVASWVVAFAIELSVLAVALLIVKNMVLPWLIPTILLMALQTLFVLGISLMLSVLVVSFRDVQHLFGIFLQFWFYATPVVYPLSIVPDRATLFGYSIPVRTLYNLNPMVRFVEAYRDLLYHLRSPSLATIGYLVAVTAASCIIGWLVFRRYEPGLAEEL